MLLHKYVSHHTAFRVLSTSKLRSSTLSSFNDPFEGQVITSHGEVTHDQLADEFCRQLDEMAQTGETVPLPVKDSDLDHMSPIALLVALYHHSGFGQITLDTFKTTLREYINKLIFNEKPIEYYQKIHTRLADYIHVLCFTSNENNLLMWAHYADHHGGAILTFDTERSQSFLQRAKKVQYASNFPQYEDISHTVSAQLQRPTIESVWLNNTLMTKSEEWSYEQEYRVLIKVTEREEDGLVSFPSENLVSIIFGCRMNETDTKVLTDLTSVRFPNVSISKAIRDPKAFKLNYQPLLATAAS